MSRTWSLHEDCHLELQSRFETYGSQFERDVKLCLQALAQAAIDNKPVNGSVDRLDFDLADIQAGKVSGWTYPWLQWRKEPWLSKINALLYLLKNQQPPWELWRGEFELRVANSFDWRFITVFQVDRLKEHVLFVWFPDLPGPD